ncbi:MAG: hypothetical protein DWQ47_17350 [Acidobacteria bacterium]|nr:MAG: hypothetical protein DWQ32_04750 [Acidobacteriota bacterium]REK02192.1 MAG: hypothetical protein DWQ38_07400 [Acidobacteriota bacterium]REK14005.1 MAG: hypothetical protein DWQ43_10440 [Acidobacteriota bacterium]REK42000.1 MAG: hypothetical protein DWQ47_17350 [Acidobacteriota bacterium]
MLRAIINIILTIAVAMFLSVAVMAQSGGDSDKKDRPPKEKKDPPKIPVRPKNTPKPKEDKKPPEEMAYVIFAIRED